MGNDAASRSLSKAFQDAYQLTVDDDDDLELSLVPYGMNRQVFGFRKEAPVKFDFNKLNEVTLDNTTALDAFTKEMPADAREAVFAVAKVCKTYGDQVNPAALAAALGVKLEAKPVDQKPVQKELDPEVAKIVKEARDQSEKLAKENAELSAKIEKETFTRVAKEHVEKAAEMFAGNAAIPGYTAATLGPVLHALEDKRALTDDQAKVLKEHFAACGNITSELTRIRGRTHFDKSATNATEEVDKLAKEKQAARPGLSIAAARVEVYRERPDLKTAINKEWENHQPTR